VSKTIPVIEIFGPTIQGEGMVIGRKTMFVRTAGCDYQCSWCDSAFTWDGTGKDDIKLMTAKQVWNLLKELGGDSFDHVTISGGNPALLSALDELLQLLNSENVKVALETQGSKWQDWFTKIDDLTISPKPPSSGMNTDYEMLDRIVTNLTENQSLFSLKVVVFNDLDFEYAKQVHLRYKNVPFFAQVGNDDITTGDNEALTQKLLLKYEWLINKVVESKDMNSVRVLPQLHTFVWGNKRGV
jgi:7-carboxy-7-deazaguanine synthase